MSSSGSEKGWWALGPGTGKWVLGSGTGKWVIGSGESGDWKERTEEAKVRAWSWASRRCWACRRRARSRRFCWSEIAGRLNGRRIS